MADQKIKGERGSCGSTQYIEGTLEAVSFEPISEKKKIFSKGIYGISAKVCIDCGKVDSLFVPSEPLKDLLAKAKK